MDSFYAAEVSIIKNASDKVFPPIGSGGATKARMSVQNIERIKPSDRNTPYSGARCDQISDDSDDEININDTLQFLDLF